MKISKCFQLAINNILSNKKRSFLTMLGIIIGIMAVIALVSLMNGITNEVTMMFDELGTTNISVNIQSRGGSRVIYPDDIYDMARENSDIIAGVSPSVNVNATLRTASSSENIKKSITGVSEVYAEMTSLDIEQGQFFDYIDVKEQENVCVIGTYIQRKLFGTSSAVGNVIKINGIPFTVVGALSEKADSSENSSDDCIYIPYTNATRMNKNAFVLSYNIYARGEENVDAATKAITAALNKELGNSDYYTVISMMEIRDMVNEITDMLTWALVFIAGISLLVGGIGIMNIMLVTVTERTKEIGIRKALGTRRRDILNQFVIEAATLSAIGGVIGIILGMLLSYFVGSLMSINAVPSVGAIVLSCGISTAIGVGFGYLPARNASLLNPIDALRFD